MLVKRKVIPVEKSFSNAKSEASLSTQVGEAAKNLNNIKQEVNKVIFGQDVVIDAMLRAILCNGHVLLEGVPGTAKTSLIKALAQASGCSSKRIQFTVDLLPTDILGLTTYDPKKGFEIVKGPIFANFIIADEINRSPPKTQSAFIEAMQEKQVTIGKETYPLPLPFFVMANQNPLESEGVYTLPEAQVDRFLFKIIIGYPEEKQERKIMVENMTFKKFEEFNLQSRVSPKIISDMQVLTHRIYLDEKIKTYILEIVQKTRNPHYKFGEFIELGASPRASIALYIASKSQALLKGRTYVIPHDVRDIAHDILRHRIILSYKARAEKITTDIIIDDILSTVKVSEE